MRFERVRAVRFAQGLASVLVLPPVMVCLAKGEALAAFAGLPQVFPVQSSLVPVVVAAAFILPAAIAGVLSLLRRAGRSMGPVLGLGLVVAGAAAYAAYADPNFIAALRI